MKVILITGLSGSGKSIALRALEDRGFFCIDNLPPDFLAPVINRLEEDGHQEVALAVDARASKHLKALPGHINTLQLLGHDVKMIFLDADNDTLVNRYSESRRRHPISTELTENATIEECVAYEREALSALESLGDKIDTSGLLSNTLKQWVGQIVDAKPARLTLILETFAFKRGVPLDADLMFDARCLPNPFYDKTLRPYSGCDAPIQDFFKLHPSAADLTTDIEQFIRKWLPRYLGEQRSYLTVAVGCTGGQHRSVYVAEQLAKRFETNALEGAQSVIIRHRSMVPAPAKNAH